MDISLEDEDIVRKSALKRGPDFCQFSGELGGMSADMVIGS